MFAVRLDGPNANSVKKHRGIRQDIRAEISKQRCVVLDVGSSIEVDHKNGKYDELSNIELENQKIDDFWCCTIKVDIENSKGQYIEKDKQEATKDGSESTKIQHGI